MATLVVGGLIAKAGGFTALSGWTLAAAVAGTVAASYVDQNFIMPALFGSDAPEQDAKVGNLRLSTTNPGAPRYRVFGRQAMVPGHFLWNLNQRAVKTTTGGGSGKGATAKQSISEKFVDLGVAICDGPIRSVIRAFGNDTLFLGSEFNDEIYSEHRLEWRVRSATPYYGVVTSGYQFPDDSHFYLRGKPSALGVKPFTEMFDVDQVVRIENTGDEHVDYGGGRHTGYFRVDRVRARSTNSSGTVFPTYMYLAPLINQNSYEARIPGTIPTGTANSPMRVRKMEAGLGGHTVHWTYHGGSAFNRLSTGQVQPTIRHIGDGDPYTDNEGNVFQTARYEIYYNPVYHVDMQGSVGTGYTLNKLLYNSEFNESSIHEDTLYLFQGFCYPDGEVAENRNGTASVTTGTDVSRWPATAKTSGLALTDGVSIDGYLTAEPVRGVLRQKWVWHDYGNSRFSGGYSNWAPNDDVTANGKIHVDFIKEDLLNHLGDDGTWQDYRPGSGRANPVYRKYTNALVQSSPSEFTGNYQVHDGDDTTSSASWTNDPSPPTAPSINYDRIQPGDWNTLEGRVGFTMYATTNGVDEELTYRYDSDGAIDAQGQETVGPQVADLRKGGPDQEPASQYQTSLEEAGDLLTSEDAPAFRGLAYMSMENLNLYQFGNTIPRLRWVVRKSDSESVGSVVRALVEDTAPENTVDEGTFSQIECLGYTVGAGSSAKEAIQPLAIAYGFHLQERNGRLKMLEKKDLPYVAVPAKHLNANQQRPLYSGLTISQEDERSLPKRLLIEYLNFGDGNEEAEGAGLRSVGEAEAGKGDTLVMNVRPTVQTFTAMKSRAQELMDEVIDESHTSSTALGPGYMDIMPGTVIGSVTNNWDDVEAATYSATGFTFENNGDVSMPIVPGSVHISFRVVFNEGLANESVENVSVTDSPTDENTGTLVGWPESLFEAGDTLPTVNYKADTSGANRFIVFFTVPSKPGNPAIVTDFPPSMNYRVDRLLTMRVSKATFNGLDMTTEAALVKQRYDGENLRPTHSTGETTFKPLPATSMAHVPVIPADVPAIYGGQGNSLKVGLVAETSNPNFPGGVIYESPNGTDQWSEVDSAVGTRGQGTIYNLDQLAVPYHRNDAPITSHVDWSAQVLLESNIRGLTLGSATREEIAQGKNNLLVGSLKDGQLGEIIGFHEAELVPQSGPEENQEWWLLRGLVRGLHKTEYAAAAQYGQEEDFVVLTDLGGAGSAYYTDPTGYAGADRDRYFRVVPPGRSVDGATTQTIPFKGASIMAPPPIVRLEHDTSNGNLTIEWSRRPFDIAPLFGMDTLPQGWFDRYEVWAFDGSASLAGVTDYHQHIEDNAYAQWVVGGQNQGSTLTTSRLTYTGAQQTSDGIVNGNAIAIVVYQIGPSGRGHRSATYLAENLVLAAGL